MPSRPPFCRFPFAACAFFGAAAFAPLAPPCHAAPLGVLTSRPQSGDVLRVFDNANVVIITNEDDALVDALLDNTHPKEKRVLSVETWGKRRTPTGARRGARVSHQPRKNSHKRPHGSHDCQTNAGRGVQRQR